MESILIRINVLHGIRNLRARWRILQIISPAHPAAGSVTVRKKCGEMFRNQKAYGPYGRGRTVRRSTSSLKAIIEMSIKSRQRCRCVASPESGHLPCVCCPLFGP